MLAATDPEIGYPRDDNRLVQSWGWYSLNDYQYDIDTGIGLNGNLFDHDSEQMTSVGKRFVAYTAPLASYAANLAILDSTLSGSTLITVGAVSPVTATISLVNAGNVDAQNVQLSVYRGEPDNGGELIAQSPDSTRLESHCGQEHLLSASFLVADWEPALYRVVLAVEAAEPDDGADLMTDQVTWWIWVLEEGQVLQQVWLPSVAWN